MRVERLISLALLDEIAKHSKKVKKFNRNLIGIYYSVGKIHDACVSSGKI